MQAQDAGLVRILCVAREGAYETLQELPTADPHCGWWGGWELETPGYPIRPRCGEVTLDTHMLTALWEARPHRATLILRNVRLTLGPHGRLSLLIPCFQLC